MNKNKFAYFCAKCKNQQTSPERARGFARTMGLGLWIPLEEIGEDAMTASVGGNMCATAIEHCLALICEPPIGRDCAWELGYAVGLGKPSFILGPLDEEDWMTKLGVVMVDFK